MHISIRTLLFASVLYLLFPFCIFLFGWISPLASVLFSLLILYALVRNTKSVMGVISIPIVTLVVGGILLLVWTLLSGVGHRGLFDGDFFKHNAILSDLITYDWPVVYKLKESHQFVYLVYYFAYYLPSAVVGKLLGWTAANISLFLWTFAGISIVYVWLLSLVKPKMQIWIALLFPFFSGLDAVGRIIMGNKIVNFTDWEWWGRNWQYSGNTTLFFYVPQQALAGWICMGILAFSFLKNKKIPLQELLFVSTLLWSPFIFIGITPFYLFMVLKKRMRMDLKITLIALFILVIQTLFFLSNFTLSVKETAASGFLWQFEKIVGSWLLLRLSLFYILEFGLFVFLLIKAKKTSSLLILATVILLLIPWYKMGLMNDFAMRASIPSLYVICLYWMMYLIESKKSMFVLFLSWLLFLVGSIYPFILQGNGIIHFSSLSPRYSLAELDGPKIRMQYLGNADSLFFTLFHKTGNNRKMGQLSLQK